MPSATFKNNADIHEALYQVNRELNRHNTVIISGIPGIGKTTLLQAFEEDHRGDYGLVRFLNGFELNGRKDLDITFKEIRNYKKALLIIDGYDEIIDKQTKEEVLNFIDKYGGRGLNILMSAKDNIEKFFPLKSAFVLRMAEWSEKEAKLFLFEMIAARELHVKDLSELESILDHIPRTPTAIQRIFDLAEDRIKPKDILQSLSSDVHYKNNLFSNSNTQLILPEQKPIIANACVIQETLIDRIKGDSSEIMKMTGREFERFMAELFEKDGYQVSLTQPTRDGGRDIILFQQTVLGKNLYYVECKRYAAHRKVSVDVIDRLYSVVTRERATKGIVVTSSSFTEPAIRVTKEIEHQMSLMDHVGLDQFIKKVSSNQIISGF